MMVEKNNLSVSVVIPTLGGATLEATIMHINKGSIKPKEVLVCIPEAYSANVDALKYDNVKIITTVSKGQVAQRAIGFQHVRCDYVLQIDDDIILAPDCIEKLLNTTVLNESFVVAPAMVNIETGRSVYSQNKSFLLRKIYCFLMNGFKGYQAGKIDKAGTPIGVNIDEVEGPLIDVEWLPGGCMMQHKRNLILADFYPFVGKAFNEDVIHSILLRKKGLSLFVATKAVCHFEVQNIPFEGSVKNLWKDYVSRKYGMMLEGKISGVRIYMYYFISFVLMMLKRLFKVRNKNKNE